mmetsp:Transcript_44136/g.134407  ORF Transcript_44136/g.134407 Transcript_44136/m.134407 type:complete len:377 (+) Transcript_44136:902-2032(+)
MGADGRIRRIAESCHEGDVSGPGVRFGGFVFGERVLRRRLLRYGYEEVGVFSRRAGEHVPRGRGRGRQVSRDLRVRSMRRILLQPRRYQFPRGTRAAPYQEGGGRTTRGCGGGDRVRQRISHHRPDHCGMQEGREYTRRTIPQGPPRGGRRRRARLQRRHEQDGSSHRSGSFLRATFPIRSHQMRRRRIRTRDRRRGRRFVQMDDGGYIERRVRGYGRPRVRSQRDYCGSVVHRRCRSRGSIRVGGIVLFRRRNRSRYGVSHSLVSRRRTDVELAGESVHSQDHTARSMRMSPSTDVSHVRRARASLARSVGGQGMEISRGRGGDSGIDARGGTALETKGVGGRGGGLRIGEAHGGARAFFDGGIRRGGTGGRGRQ